MPINLILEDKVTGAPAGWLDTVRTAAQIIDDALNLTNITINIRVGFESVTSNGSTHTADANSGFDGPINGTAVSYGDFVTLLRNHSPSADDTQAYNLLPATAPDGHNQVLVYRAQEKALGFTTDFNGNPVGANDGADDGFAVFGTGVSVGLALHELTHAMGRSTRMDAPTRRFSLRDIYEGNCFKRNCGDAPRMGNFRADVLTLKTRCVQIVSRLSKLVVFSLCFGLRSTKRPKRFQDITKLRGLLQARITRASPSQNRVWSSPLRACRSCD